MRIIKRNRNGHDPWKGLAAGAAGGLVASWVMNQFQALWSRKTHGIERSHGAQSLQQGSPQHGVARELRERGRDRESDNAAVRAANDIFSPQANILILGSTATATVTMNGSIGTEFDAADVRDDANANRCWVR